MKLNKLLRWTPWKFFIRRLAQSHGFVDPIALLARVYNFSQPSEIKHPTELLRAGVIFHARGLLNTQVLQHNLDWVWPYWVERQFDPHDDAFLPRAFSVTHVNLTLRNWTAVGLPSFDQFPIIDPRGLVTPFWDGWSIDTWLVGAEGELFPSRALCSQQKIIDDQELKVHTSVQSRMGHIETICYVSLEEGIPTCVIEVAAQTLRDAFLVCAIRPANPEGVSLIYRIEANTKLNSLTVDEDKKIHLSPPAEAVVYSNFDFGDVAMKVISQAHHTLHKAVGAPSEPGLECRVGLASAAATYAIHPGSPRKIVVKVPLSDEAVSRYSGSTTAQELWRQELREATVLQVPNEKFCSLYRTAIKTLLLHSPLEVFPGPYTYKRFWYRDAAFILHGLLCVNLSGRVKRCLDRFPLNQTLTGYFLSQEGEWDSNGEVLWIFGRYLQLMNEKPESSWVQSVQKGVTWIARHRVAIGEAVAHAGLFPAGFSAEHLGPSDFYYWDDFWGVAGLESAKTILAKAGLPSEAAYCNQLAQEFRSAIQRSIHSSRAFREQGSLAASPYRRMDAGAIGSLVASYPLRIYEPRDPTLLATVEFLLEKCFFENSFFQDMIHSGSNAYLTLHVAQVLLRAHDPRFFGLIEEVAKLASETGQWPEAIHPRTKGGCMGDGQHAWASAEWVLMMRSLFVEEGLAGLIFLAGIPVQWLVPGTKLFFGPTPTKYGTVTISATVGQSYTHVFISATWHEQQPLCVVRLLDEEYLLKAGEVEVHIPHRHAV